MITNHWGKWVDSEEPITGVICNNNIEWLGDEIAKGINLTLDGMTELELQDCDESSADTYLIGSWKKDENGLYEPDKSGQYAAICGEIYTQVVWSNYFQRCQLCSPCYVGQGDLDSLGEYQTFAVPPEISGIM
jgi:hypothetical protein